jgi:hypothetical protein
MLPAGNLTLSLTISVSTGKLPHSLHTADGEPSMGNSIRQVRA